MSIKEVPMLTADEKEIKLNAIVYKGHWSSGYNFSKEGKFEIEAYRVISVDNSRRHFRLRCKNGCESEYQFSKGCVRDQIFGKIENVKEKILHSIEKDLKKCSEKVNEVYKTQAHIELQLKKLDALLDVKYPKEVKI